MPAVPPSSSGAMSLIASAILGVAAATIDLTSIPAGFSLLNILLITQTDNASNQNLLITFNGDSGNNYDCEQSNANASSPTATESSNAAASLNIGAVAPSNATGCTLSTTISLPWYSATTFHKTLVASGTLTLGTATTNYWLRSASGRWRSTAAINRITLTLAAGNFIAGTQWAMYGVQ